MGQFAKTGKPTRFEHPLTVLGKNYWFETHIGPLKTNGKITKATLISINITARKRAEKLLREVWSREHGKQCKKYKQTVKKPKKQISFKKKKTIKKKRRKK